MATTDRTLISYIRVKGLFGAHNYTIELSPGKASASTVSILYGDNGCGKSTILRLIFHLLACETDRGHRTYVARAQFQEFTIKFSSGVSVTAVRPEGQHTGSYELRVTTAEQSTVATFDVEERGNETVVSSKYSEEKLAVVSAIAKLELVLFFLGDDRTVMKSPERPESNELRLLGRSEREHSSTKLRDWQRAVGPQPEPDIESLLIRQLDILMQRAAGYIRDVVLKATRRGETNAHTVYSQIIEQLAKMEFGDVGAKPTARDELERHIAQIEETSKGYSRFGFLSRFSGRKLTEAIQQSDPRKLMVIDQVLGPYLDGLDARIIALHDIQQRVETLVETLNKSFLSNKTISYRLGQGFKIRSSAGSVLESSMLSSGEKHLLLIFCSAFLAPGKNVLMLIDEPEISLNIKWQRLLIGALLKCNSEDAAQYLFATHSMELLAGHLERVIPLTHLL